MIRSGIRAPCPSHTGTGVGFYQRSAPGLHTTREWCPLRCAPSSAASCRLRGLIHTYIYTWTCSDISHLLQSTFSCCVTESLSSSPLQLPKLASLHHRSSRLHVFTSTVLIATSSLLHSRHIHSYSGLSYIQLSSLLEIHEEGTDVLKVGSQLFVVYPVFADFDVLPILAVDSALFQLPYWTLSFVQYLYI